MRLINRDDRCADIGWVEVAGGNIRPINVPDPANVQIVGAASNARKIIGLKNRHIAADAAGPVDEATRCGIVFDRNDNFQKLIAEREDAIGQSELADARIDITFAEIQNMS